MRHLSPAAARRYPTWKGWRGAIGPLLLAALLTASVLPVAGCSGARMDQVEKDVKRLREEIAEIRRS